MAESRTGTSQVRQYENPYLEVPMLRIARCSVCRMEIGVDPTTGTLVEHKVAYPGPRCGGSASIGELTAVVRRV